MVLRDLEQIVPKKNVNPRYIEEGIEILEKRKDIIVRPVDKGGGVVILLKEFYHNQLTEMLTNGKTYKKLERDPTVQYEEELRLLVETEYQTRVLSNKERKYLVPSSSHIPKIYTLPKIHKDVQCPPARPIVNGIGSVTSRMGQYLDQLLQKNVVQTKAYRRVTKNLLQLIQEVDLTGKDEVYLVTADVSSLYTIIQHDDTLLALNWALCQRDDIPHNQKIFMRNALDFCLSHNYFWYNGKFYSQKRGVVMGAKFAPSIASLFMGEWEDKTIFFVKREELLLYRRYIDDLFFIWAGSTLSLQCFLKELNANTNNIRLTSEYSKYDIHFLDVNVYRRGEKLETKVYFKPTDCNSYLPYCQEWGFITGFHSQYKEVE